MEEAIVLYPTTVIGHLVAMVELGKHIFTHRPSLSIHILIAKASYDDGSASRYIATITHTMPFITFHNLPAVTLPPTFLSSTSNHESLLFEVIRLTNPNLLQALQSISKSYTIHALIADFFGFQVLSIASQLNIPVYYFVTCGAANLASFLYLSTIHRTFDKSIKDLDTCLNVPGVPPIPSLDMPKPLLDRNDQAYKSFIESSSLAPKTAGIIVNTFEALEPTCLKAISDGLCVPDSPTPPVYCVGPLIMEGNQRGAASDGGGGGVGDGHECLKWLDSQPRKSVVFLCFGSLGLFAQEQLHQLAGGLERSGKRFLWVVRNPPLEHSPNLAVRSQEDPDLNSLLPEGFLQRTQNRGMVVKKWAPQVAVLNHESVGGFVTHCGWNSVLEAVCAGVPMVAWPLYAEQRFNRVMLVEEMGMALRMQESESGMVTAAEVEERVRELMESEKGEVLRKRVMAAKDEAEAALCEGGSSQVALSKLVESWNRRD